jgi:hypothetical protein
VALACAPATGCIGERPLASTAWLRRRMLGMPLRVVSIEGGLVGSVIKKRRKRMAKKKHRKLLRKTRVQRRNKK